MGIDPGQVRSFVARIANWAVAGVVAVVVLPIAGQFSINVAQQNGVFDHPWAVPMTVIGFLLSVISTKTFGWIGGLVIGFGAGTWLDSVLRRREVAPPSPLAQPLAATHGEDHDKLVEFIVRALEPACDKLVRLQAHLIDQMIGDDRLKKMAKDGLYSSPVGREFRSILDEFAELSCSPPGEISLLELIRTISRLENGAYRQFGAQLQELARVARVDFQTYWLTDDEWKAWWDSHEHLVAAYESIKISSAYNTRRYGEGFPSLYRPGLTSRWGDLHDFKYDPN